MDRLDEIISSGEECQDNEDWNDDIAAAKELIVCSVEEGRGTDLGSTGGEDKGVVGSVL